MELTEEDPAEIKPETVVPGEQIVYARLLQWGSHTALMILVASFVVYLFSLMPMRIPHEELAKVWELPVSRYLQAMDMGAGWDWVRHIRNGDVLPLVGVAFLASVTLLCYVPLLVVFLRKREFMYSLICLAEILVLTLAASGVLTVGH